jgi:hypothetical protein
MSLRRTRDAFSSLVRRHVPPVELDLLDPEHVGPAGLVSYRILERRSRIVLVQKRSIASGSPASTSAYRHIAWNRIRLAAAEQPLKRLDTDVPAAVAKLGER